MASHAPPPIGVKASDSAENPDLDPCSAGVSGSGLPMNDQSRLDSAIQGVREWEKAPAAPADGKTVNRSARPPL